MMENNKGKTQYIENRRHRWLKIIYLKIDSSAGNNSRSSDIVRPNFENVRPISHYDRTR